MQSLFHSTVLDETARNLYVPPTDGPKLNELILIHGFEPSDSGESAINFLQGRKKTQKRPDLEIKVVVRGDPS
jgi:hypothetical protein